MAQYFYRFLMQLIGLYTKSKFWKIVGNYSLDSIIKIILDLR